MHSSARLHICLILVPAFLAAPHCAWSGREVAGSLRPSERVESRGAARVHQDQHGTWTHDGPAAAEHPGTISDVEARLALARLLATSGDRLEEASTQYRILLGERPKDSRIRLEFAQILLRQQRYGPAGEELRHVLRLRPGDKSATVSLARLCLWQGEHGEAIRWFLSLRGKHPLDADEMRDMARAYTWNRQYPQALELYEMLESRHRKSNPDLYLEWGDVCLYSGNIAGAIEKYRIALGREAHSAPARRKLGLALSWSNQDEEALALLHPLHSEDPSDVEVARELARLHGRSENREEALAFLRRVSSRFPEDMGILLELADLEGNLGHARTCRDLYARAFAMEGGSEQLSLRYAGRMMGWGDFYGAEKIYLQYLERHPDARDVRQKLAWVLVSAQRYEEGAAIYRRLMVEGHDPFESRLQLAKAQYLENSLEESLASLVPLTEVPESEKASCTQSMSEALLLRGDILCRLKRYEEASETYDRLLPGECLQTETLLALGKQAVTMGNREKAREYFAQAVKIAPENSTARFYADELYLDSIPMEPSRRLPPASGSPLTLVEYGRLYAVHGLYDSAIKCFRTALEKDRDCFPAQMSLAEIQAVHGQYEEAIDRFRALHREFPGNSKILLSWARALAWSRQYEDALRVYDDLRVSNPRDPVPAREAARTAAWGKEMDRAQRIYGSLWEEPVDARLLQMLPRASEDAPGTELREVLERCGKLRQRGAIFEGYEHLEAELPRLKEKLPGGTAMELEHVLLALEPAYRIQKSSRLESRAKQLAWDKKFEPALDVYQELVRFQPGNQEALFDASQVQCALGLRNQESATLQELLVLDPLHTLANQALRKREAVSGPALRTGYSFWKEKGYGDLSGISRQRGDVTAQLPLGAQNRLLVSAHGWHENPTDRGGVYWAYGHSLGWEGVIDARLRGAVLWTRKYYEDSRLDDTNTGHARFWINVRNHLELGVGYERTDELYNDFGIMQGLQADSGWLTVSSHITRKLKLSGQARYTGFSDGNDQQSYGLSAEYDLTDHPRMLRFILSSEYKDTGEDNVFVYRDSELVDIIHPYWAPRDYLSAAAAVEWRHDLSKSFFCGADSHHYGARVSVGTDTDDNPFIAVGGEWHFELLHRWMFDVKSLVHRSRDWNAYGLWATLQYHF